MSDVFINRIVIFCIHRCIPRQTFRKADWVKAESFVRANACHLHLRHKHDRWKRSKVIRVSYLQKASENWSQVRGLDWLRNRFVSKALDTSRRRVALWHQINCFYKHFCFYFKFATSSEFNKKIIGLSRRASFKLKRFISHSLTSIACEASINHDKHDVNWHLEMSTCQRFTRSYRIRGEFLDSWLLIWQQIYKWHTIHDTSFWAMSRRAFREYFPSFCFFFFTIKSVELLYWNSFTL